MKIGITCYPTVGGSGVVASELGHALARRGHEIHFICYAQPFRLRPAPNLYFHQIDIPRYPLFEYPSYGMAAASRMAQIAKAYDLDILHVHYAYPHGVSAWLARQISGLARLKTVVTLHGTDITLIEQDETFYNLTRFAIANCDAVTAVSQYLKQKTQAWFGRDHEIGVIPNFVDTGKFAPGNTSEEAGTHAGGEKIVVHVSNFRPIKRSLDMVRIFAGIRSELPARLLMVGTGPELEVARGLARELDVLESVQFMGDARDVDSLLPRADLMVTTSEVEGFGLAPLEAMSCGVPVVATRTGGLPELISDGEDGFLCPPGDISEMTRRSLEVLSDAHLHLKFRENGRRKAVREYDLNGVVPRYEELYERMLVAPDPMPPMNER